MPVIAMSREIGSGGSEVAAGVADELGLKVINSEIVAGSVAGRLGVEESTVQRYLSGSASLLDRWQIDKRKLARYTSEEIVQLAQQGNVLIRGWGAAALFRDIPQIVSVRICAPLDSRVHAMMHRLGATDHEDVRGEIERFDAAHAKTMNTSFDVNWNDPLLYHIVLNSARIPVDTCIKYVCQLARDPRIHEDAAIRPALADKLLKLRVMAALSEEISIGEAPAGVTVSVTNGRVTLTGASSTGYLRDKVETVASRVAGVRSIDNQIVSVPARGG
jgi:cytidylate kinase